MFDNIKECLNQFENTWKNVLKVGCVSTQEESILNFFDLHLAESIMKDLESDQGEKLAKIILVSLGMSNETKS